MTQRTKAVLKAKGVQSKFSDQEIEAQADP